MSCFSTHLHTTVTFSLSVTTTSTTSHHTTTPAVCHAGIMYTGRPSGSPFWRSMCLLSAMISMTMILIIVIEIIAKEYRTALSPRQSLLKGFQCRWLGQRELVERAISYRFGDIAAYCSNFGHCVFEPPFGGLGTMYDIHLGLIKKLRLRRYEQKQIENRLFAQGRSIIVNFRVETDDPHQSFIHG